MAEVLSLSKTRIIDGVLAFGIAHIVYIYAFNLLFKGNYSWWILLLGIIIATILYYFVGYNHELPNKLLVATFIYSLILSSLLISIIMYITSSGVTIIVIITSLLGIILFIVSDSVLAYNEFKKKIKNASELIAITYVLSQILLQLTPLVISLS